MPQSQQMLISARQTHAETNAPAELLRSAWCRDLNRRRLLRLGWRQRPGHGYTHVLCGWLLSRASGEAHERDYLHTYNSEGWGTCPLPQRRHLASKDPAGALSSLSARKMVLLLIMEWEYYRYASHCIHSYRSCDQRRRSQSTRLTPSKPATLPPSTLQQLPSIYS
jgi:hypothetical protein